MCLLLQFHPTPRLPAQRYSAGANSADAVHGGVTPSGRFALAAHTVGPTTGNNSEVEGRGHSCVNAQLLQSGNRMTEVKRFLEPSRMRNHFAIVALLVAGLAIARQPASIACSVPFSQSQRVVAVHAAVVRLADAARAAFSVQSGNTRGSALGVDNSHAPNPNFAVPGPGWG